MVLLVLGAVINVAVAWSGASLSHFPNGLAEQPDPRAWPAQIPSHWPAAPKLISATGGFWTVNRFCAEIIVEVDGSTAKTECFLIDHFQFGWPMRSLQSERWSEPVYQGRPPKVTMSHRIEGHPQPSIWREGVPIAAGFGMISLDPVWLGFAIDTIFYAVILWAILAMTFALRRQQRLGRNLCAACAYPIGVSPVCTECGATVTAR